MGFKMSQMLGSSKYLKAADVQTPTLVTITNIAVEEIGPDKDRKPVAYFAELEKGLVLNKVNGNTIADIAGDDDSDKLVGIKVVLYADTTDYGGQRVPCIRVRAPRNQAAKSTPPANDAAAHNTVAASDAAELNESDIPF